MVKCIFQLNCIVISYISPYIVVNSKKRIRSENELNLEVPLFILYALSQQFHFRFSIISKTLIEDMKYEIRNRIVLTFPFRGLL